MMTFKEWLENTTSLYQQLLALRPQMAQAAQQIYNSWDQSGEFGDEQSGFGGICDEIAREIGGIIVGNIADVDITDGGQDGDDHAHIVAYNQTEAYGVDIPHHVYERGGGYNWEKIDGVQFRPEHVEIWQMERDGADYEV